MSLLAAEPYEAGLLADLCRLLRQISVAGGYHTDAGQRVFMADERLDPKDGDGISLILHDGTEQLGRQDGYVRDVKLTVDVEIYVPVGPDTDGRHRVRSTARKALRDVRTAVLQGLKGGSWKVEPIDIQLEGRTLFPLETGSQFQYAIQPIVFTMREETQSL